MELPVEQITDIVAIDGPAGVGKSTLARRVAKVLNYAFLDTGAMYRAATWWALHQRVDLTDRGAVIQAARDLPLSMTQDNGVPRVTVDGHDVTEAIRTPEVTNQIKYLDGIPEVRAKLVELQREIGAQGPTVAEGRDIGTVVFPHAKCKIFLTASIEERTRRRAAQLAENGSVVDEKQLQADIHRRDESDRNRETSPLRPAPDATIIDTTDMTEDEVLEAILAQVRRAS